MATQTTTVVDGVKTPIMSLKHISKYFGGVQALDGVDMDICRGEVIVLVGDNGAGKSTFLKVISGVNIPEQGEIYFDGKAVTISNTLDSVELGIQTVYQDLALCDNLDIVQNLFLGRELTRHGRLNEADMEHIAQECLNELGIEIQSVRAKAGALSGGQRQAVAIARAMLGSPDIVLLDEPLANLGLKQRQQVCKLIMGLREKNVGVVVVSHDLAEVFPVCDKVVVFRLGEKVAEIERADITTERVVAEITGSNSFLEEE
ncbi:ATP-binding cassette domain-containing protein [Agathobaculum sp.]|uniref:ATP-binding cassette domain-containing protein n=1 Tax=Agathobaculum sp. TaxID=2048138 RepID=UPI002A8111AC|nr:ATP-binding cassette domain-containing protein [Agathobaculum sp.]MDY3619064.1 ATP-binding cassette domain-containing protein [Agathobaculum sp.]